MAEQNLRADKRRLAVFTDAFIAFVMVMMAADLRTVAPADPAALDEWAAAAPHLLAYVLGFFTLAVAWVNHSYLTGALEAPTRGAAWMNLLVLFWVSLFPVGVGLLGRADPLEAGAVAYGVVLTGMSMSLLSLRIFLKRRSSGSLAMAALSEMSTYRSAAASLICAGSIPLAFINPILSILCFIAAPAIFLLPESRSGRA